MRLGLYNSYGYIVSPPISLSENGTASSLAVSFYIAAQNANAIDKATLTVSVEGTDLVSPGYAVTSAVPASDTSYFLSSNDNLKRIWTISDISSLPDPFQLRFATSVDGRVCIDQIVVTETYSSGLPKLSTPVVLAPSTNYTGFVLSWVDVSGATGYTVSVNDTVVANCGPSETTTTVTGLSEGTSYDVSIVAKGDGTTHDDSDAATLRVTTLTAPVVTEPDLSATVVSPSSVTVSWPAQNDATFAVRAWTLVPVDVATENFTGYPDDRPTGWSFNTTLDAYNSDAAIVKLDASGESVVSPTYPAVVSLLSFKLQGHGAEGSSVSVSGSSDGTTWNELTNIVLTSSTKVNEFVLPDIANRGMKVFKWKYTRSNGGVGFGTVSVTGTGVGKQPSYLTGYGPDATAVAGTSVTISNPVADETNYVEVTATGLSGKTASATIEVPVPAVATQKPVVISVK